MHNIWLLHIQFADIPEHIISNTNTDINIVCQEHTVKTQMLRRNNISFFKLYHNIIK